MMVKLFTKLKKKIKFACGRYTNINEFEWNKKSLSEAINISEKYKEWSILNEEDFYIHQFNECLHLDPSCEKLKKKFRKQKTKKSHSYYGVENSADREMREDFSPSHQDLSLGSDGSVIVRDFKYLDSKTFMPKSKTGVDFFTDSKINHFFSDNASLLSNGYYYHNKADSQQKRLYHSQSLKKLKETIEYCKTQIEYQDNNSNSNNNNNGIPPFSKKHSCVLPFPSSETYDDTTMSSLFNSEENTLKKSRVRIQASRTSSKLGDVDHYSQVGKKFTNMNIDLMSEVLSLECEDDDTESILV